MESKKRKIYLASSWRNKYQPEILKAIRSAGHSVYDFKNPLPGNNGFHWSEIDPNWKNWDTESYIQALRHPIADNGFGLDWGAMKWADTGVLLLPCGRSAHLEAGYFVGSGKQLHILIPEQSEPELMYNMATGIYSTVEQLITALCTSN